MLGYLEHFAEIAVLVLAIGFMAQPLRPSVRKAYENRKRPSTPEEQEREDFEDWADMNSAP
jgi:hypothetical protein